MNVQRDNQTRRRRSLRRLQKSLNLDPLDRAILSIIGYTSIHRLIKFQRNEAMLSYKLRHITDDNVHMHL